MAKSIAIQELLELTGLVVPGPAQVDAMIAALAANGTLDFNQTLAAGGMMGENASATPAANQTRVPTLSIPGGLTNVTGGVDNTS